MAANVEDNTERSRYEISKDGAVVGFADYSLEGDTVVFPHTVIDSAQRGQGLAGTLVQHALDDVRAKGKRVVAECSYVAQFIDDHPEYADLLAD